jgi:hypothetical protein
MSTSLVPCLQPRARLETGGAQVEVGGGTRGWRMETGDTRHETRDTRHEAGGWRLEAGGWRLEAGGWRLEAGGWRLEAGGSSLEAPAELAQSLGEASILLLASQEPQALRITLLLPQKTCQSTPGSSSLSASVITLPVSGIVPVQCRRAGSHAGREGACGGAARRGARRRPPPARRVPPPAAPQCPDAAFWKPRSRMKSTQSSEPRKVLAVRTTSESAAQVAGLDRNQTSMPRSSITPARTW